MFRRRLKSTEEVFPVVPNSAGLMSTLKLLALSLCFFTFAMCGFDEKVLLLEKKHRVARTCGDQPNVIAGAGVMAGGMGAGGGITNSIRHMGILMSILVVAFGILLGLICLGILKALLGILFFPKLGMCGMNLLVDLPRPMKNYQEPELAEYAVIYDVAGWPIHPQTGRRSVRPLARNTEFCMNVIFFVTYPFIILVTCCSQCCYRSYDEEGTDTNVYENVNTVVFSEYPTIDTKRKGSKCRGGCGRDVYRDDDSAEEHDTKYVMEQMGRSSDGLRK